MGHPVLIEILMNVSFLMFFPNVRGVYLMGLSWMDGWDPSNIGDWKKKEEKQP